ncbi:MAG: hypothetical protein ABIH59_02645 [archaeon]
MKILNITAKITGMKYSPFLCRNLPNYKDKDFDLALAKESSFILELDNKNKLAISSWVSAKRTRSYPYARVYDTLSFAGKKVTIIPIFKDEGLDGDRDFLQWDTISLMSLLGIYVIISYYKSAEKSSKYGNKKGNKITNQRFDTEQIKFEIEKILSYQSDALHWNLEQIGKAGEIGKKALDSYEKISKQTGVKMSSKSSGENRIKKLLQDKKIFMQHSRFLAERAQKRESSFTQPHENVDGSKATLTITNYLKGNYFFTCDESKIVGKKVFLIEAKHTKTDKLPSMGDIKDGLIKMILFTNIKNAIIDKREYLVNPMLKLTTGNGFNLEKFKEMSPEFFNRLIKESNKNKFLIKINNTILK